VAQLLRGEGSHHGAAQEPPRAQARRVAVPLAARLELQAVPVALDDEMHQSHHNHLHIGVTMAASRGLLLGLDQMRVARSRSEHTVAQVPSSSARIDSAIEMSLPYQ